MYALVTVAILVAFGGLALRLPRELRASYFRSFGARHGTAFQVGVTVLITLIFAMVVLTLVHPGVAVQLERLNAAVALIGAVAAAFDLRAFAAALRRRRAVDDGES